MANPWFRLYSEFADDPKVQSMPEVMQRRLIMLFCLRCKDETFDVTLQAFHWRITPEDMQATKKLFLFHGFIDEDWELLNWNRRQFLSDSSTERTRKYRQRLKQGETSQNVTNPEDFDKDGTGRNVTVTAPDTDTDTDSEAEQTEREAPSAHRDGKKFGLSMRQALEGLSDDNLGQLAQEIACRHPRARQRSWTPRNVSQADTVAVLDAMQAESELHGVTMAEAGKAMLGFLEAWDAVPRDKWKFARPIDVFFKQADYRLEPNELIRQDPQEGKAHGKRRGTEGNNAALREFLEGVDPASEGDSVLAGVAVGGVPKGSDPDDVPAVHGGVGGPDSGRDSSSLFPRRTGVPGVVSASRYPPRIQRPTNAG